jgi:hypothetical protein
MALALALLLALLAAPATAAPTAPATTPALHADGARIVDASDRQVLLRGGEFAGPVDLRVVQAVGWNVVWLRLPLPGVADGLTRAGIQVIQPKGLLGALQLSPVPGIGSVFSPVVASADALQAAVARGGGARPVVVTWPANVDPQRTQDALDGLGVGAIATGVSAIDPRGALARAYVRAAPGKLLFSHYEEAKGHFAAKGVAARTNAAPVEIFYPGAKHRGAKFRARGLGGLRAERTPGGGRLVYGVPTGTWSFQIGPSLT